MTTCARCPAPATHACDCGATGCDAHRGCEHEPGRLRPAPAAALAAIEARASAGVDLDAVDLRRRDAYHGRNPSLVAASQGDVWRLGDEVRSLRRDALAAVAIARDALRERDALAAAARAYLATRDHAAAATTAEGVSTDDALAAMAAEESAAEALRRAAGL